MLGRYGLIEDSDDEEAAPQEGPGPRDAPNAGRGSDAAKSPEDAAAAEGWEQGPQEEEAMQLSAHLVVHVPVSMFPARSVKGVLHLSKQGYCC